MAMLHPSKYEVKCEDGKMTDIEAIIYCEKESHKGIIIGKNWHATKKKPHRKPV